MLTCRRGSHIRKKGRVRCRRRRRRRRHIGKSHPRRIREQNHAAPRQDQQQQQQEAAAGAPGHRHLFLSRSVGKSEMGRRQAAGSKSTRRHRGRRNTRRTGARLKFSTLLLSTSLSGSFGFFNATGSRWDPTALHARAPPARGPHLAWRISGAVGAAGPWLSWYAAFHLSGWILAFCLAPTLSTCDPVLCTCASRTWVDLSGFHEGTNI